jgi:predicted protein tyrosine phosphatase
VHLAEPHGAGQVGEGLRATHAQLFQYLHIKVDDVPEEDLVAHFPRCFAFIDQACKDDTACVSGGGVLVHCAAGVSRSATVCIGCAVDPSLCPVERACWPMESEAAEPVELLLRIRSATRHGRGRRAGG